MKTLMRFRMNDDFLSLFFDIMPIHAYKKDTNGVFIKCNKA
jgi:hypothetical protein